MPFKNHVQIEEARLPAKALWDKRVRRNELNPRGIETPLGHSYSLILEELAREGLDTTPQPNEFLGHIGGYLRRRGWEYEALNISLQSPSLDMTPILEYIKIKHLSREACSRVMEEIGFNPEEYFTCL